MELLQVVAICTAFVVLGVIIGSDLQLQYISSTLLKAQAQAREEGTIVPVRFTGFLFKPTPIIITMRPE